ncbi:MAG TPA: hypothetical protein PKH16_16145 [Aequorivita sp.]|nr:hypothetical protein [Aequorivita sp.]
MSLENHKEDGFAIGPFSMVPIDASCAKVLFIDFSPKCEVPFAELRDACSPLPLHTGSSYDSGGQKSHLVGRIKKNQVSYLLANMFP